MRVSTLRSPAFATVLAALLVAACSDDSTERGGGPESDPESLHASIGPEGGVIAGAKGTAFEGVRLAISKGALAKVTDVSIRAIIDETPLPERAERVGVQFAVEPASATLASPAELTLPVNAPLVRRFGEDTADVKVWLRKGEAWELQEAVDSEEGSVTIELPALTTAAAGVKLPIGGDLCATLGICHQIPSTCQSSTGFCVSSLGTPSPRPGSAFGFETDGSALYYGVEDTALNARVARLDLATSTVTQSSPIANVGPSVQFPFATSLVIDTDKSVWSGLLFMGHAQFRFGSDSKIVPRQDSTDSALAAVLTKNGSLVLLSTEGRKSRINGAFQSFAKWPSNQHPTIANTSGFAPDLGSNARYWAPFALGSLSEFDAADVTVSQGDSLPNTAVINPQASMASAPDGTIAVVDSKQRVLMAHPGQSLLIPVANLTSIRDISFDSGGALWMTTQVSNEVLVLEATGTLRSIVLDADQLPVGIRAVSGGALVMTGNREVLRIKRNGTN